MTQRNKEIRKTNESKIYRKKKRKKEPNKQRKKE
jgi:hypothetical protein